jgi:diaminopropionate ammonia-lyase
MTIEPPVQWFDNRNYRPKTKILSVPEVIPPGQMKQIRSFHRQIPAFRMSPLLNLSNLADRLGLGGIWVKDESARLNQGSFKVLGGSYALYQIIKKRLGRENEEIPFEELTSKAVKEKIGDLVFATATDGNHGRGIAWSASQLGFRSVIYVHKLTTLGRIRAIEQNGGEVVVVDGNYDDAVRQVFLDAGKNGWEVVSDTSWEGYESVPKWVMQGYTTMLFEVQEQLAGQGFSKPTHVFVQAGVGSLAAATIGFYHNLFGEEKPISVVVEPTKAACLYQSALFGDGKPHSVVGDLDTIMAGLACGDPNPIAWNVLSDCADFFTISPDYVAAKGMRVYGFPLSDDPDIISGESGAVTLGTLMYIMEYPGLEELRDRIGLNKDSQVLLINTEGNTSPEEFRDVVWNGGIPVPEEYKIHRNI